MIRMVSITRREDPEVECFHDLIDERIRQASWIYDINQGYRDPDSYTKKDLGLYEVRDVSKGFTSVGEGSDIQSALSKTRKKEKGWKLRAAEKIIERVFYKPLDGVYYRYLGLRKDLGLPVHSVAVNRSRFEYLNRIFPLIDSKVNVRSGTYSCSSGVSCANNSVMLAGEGWDTLLSASSGLNTHVLEVTGDYNHFRDFSVDGNSASQSGTCHGIYNHGANNTYENIEIEDCLTDGLHSGESTWNMNSMGGWIRYGRIALCGRYGMMLDYTSTDYQIEGFLIRGQSSSGDAGLVVDNSSARISNFHLWGNYYNVILAPSHGVYRIDFVNIGFLDNINHNVIKSSSVTFANNHFTGCYFWGKLSSGSAVRDTLYVSSSGTFGRNVIVGCVFLGENESGTHQAQYAINAPNSNFNYNVILGNTIEGFTQASPLNTYAGSNVQDHNVVYDCG